MSMMISCSNEQIIKAIAEYEARKVNIKWVQELYFELRVVELEQELEFKHMDKMKELLDNSEELEW